MIFTKLIFLKFLGITLLAFYLTPAKFKKYTLIISSLVFAFLIDKNILIPCAVIALFNYFMTKIKYGKIPALVLDISAFCGFLYLDYRGIFILSTFAFSFFIMRMILFTFDFHDGNTEKLSLVDFIHYTFYFPTFFAGPCLSVNAFDFKGIDLDRIRKGIFRLALGLFKLSVIASSTFAMYESIKALAETSVLSYFLMLLSFIYTAYFAYSGYSDIAVGTSRMFGYELPESFNYPMTSRSLGELISKWNISVSDFFNNCVYARLFNGKTYIKYIGLYVTPILWGIFHGIAKRYLLLGGILGVILLLERAVFDRFVKKIPLFLRHIYTFVIIMGIFVPFAFGDIAASVKGFSSNTLFTNEILFILQKYIILLVIVFISSTSLIKRVFKTVINSKQRELSAIFEVLTVSLLLILAYSYIITGEPIYIDGIWRVL